jgi:hypothetical protein
VELVKPVYEQVCVFTRGTPSSVRGGGGGIFSFFRGSTSNATTSQQPQEQSEEVVEQESIEQQPLEGEQSSPTRPPLDIAAKLEKLNDPRSMTSDELMEMHNPTCSNCGKRSLDHKSDADQNGWRVARYTALSKPRGWPTYNATSGTWSM